MKFVLFVMAGIVGLPLTINCLDVFAPTTNLPLAIKQALAFFGGLTGAILYLFTFPAIDSESPKQ